MNPAAPDPRGEDLPDLRAVQLRRKRRLAAALAVLLTLMLFVGSAWPGEAWPRRLIENGGLALIFAAIVGRAWCSLYIGGRKKTELVQDGPYALCRNPLYLFSFVGSFGAGAQTGSLSLALIFTGATAAVFAPVIRQEEIYLSRAFPRTYPAYARTTPRLAPDLTLWRSPGELTIRPIFFLRTLADGLPFLLAWPLFEFLARLQDGPWPPLIRLP